MIYANEFEFKDLHGRYIMLRGVNLGGSSKIPLITDPSTITKERYKEASFVGRPFPISEADEHFSRLRYWGFNALRFIITWKAIEHFGPGIYDFAYLEYLQEIVEKAGEYGFQLIIDSHQDAWSFWTGGDGAPSWTLEAVGFNISTLHESGAAFLKHEHQGPFPWLRWVVNYDKLAAATMFTLFFGGNDFAPKTLVEGMKVQDFLQSHYINAIKKVAGLFKNMPHVLGYDALNEPSPGWIGRTDLTNNQALFSDGHSPTPFQSMLLGSGIPQIVVVTKMGLAGLTTLCEELVNPHGLSAWRKGYKGVWHENEVWSFLKNGEPYLERPDHFSMVNGSKVNFANDYFRPFIEKFSKEIRSVHPQAIIFVEQPLGSEMPHFDLPNIANGSHWYDAFILFKRRFYPFLAVDVQANRLVFFRKAIRRSFAKQLRYIKEHVGFKRVKGPTIIGEFGIPYNLENKAAFTEGNFSSHLQAMNRSWEALEENLLSAAVWNYTGDNSNKHGDHWNDEDFSIFSRDQIHPLDSSEDLNAGGRAVAAFMRPYPRATAGCGVELIFDYETADFTYAFKHDPSIEAPTELYVPKFHYPNGLGIKISDGTFHYDETTQIFTYYHTKEIDTHIINFFRKRDSIQVIDEYLLEKSYIKANGLTFHLVQCGPPEGDPVLFLHGFPECWYGWRCQISDLIKKGYRLIIPDQRGYNLSDKPSNIKEYRPDLLVNDVIGILDALGQKKVNIVGHDWGGIIAWWAAAEHPDRFKKVVILNAPHFHVYTDCLKRSFKQMCRSAYAAFFRIPFLPEVALKAGNWKLLEKALCSWSGRSDSFTSEDMVHYKKAWEQPGAIKGMLNWYRAACRYPKTVEDPVVKIPLLLLWGGKDLFLGREMAKSSIEKYTVDGQYIFIEEATHWIQHDEPLRVNRYIDRFFTFKTNEKII